MRTQPPASLPPARHGAREDRETTLVKQITECSRLRAHNDPSHRRKRVRHDAGPIPDREPGNRHGDQLSPRDPKTTGQQPPKAPDSNQHTVHRTILTQRGVVLLPTFVKALTCLIVRSLATVPAFPRGTTEDTRLQRVTIDIYDPGKPGFAAPVAAENPVMEFSATRWQNPAFILIILASVRNRESGNPDEIN